MSFADLSEFLAVIEHDGELVRIRTDVDPVLEIAEISDRLCQNDNGGPAILFENVRGSAFPVLTNLLGSERRLCHALRCESFDHVKSRIHDLLHPQLEEGWLGSLKLIPQLSHLTKLPPKTVKSGRSQQVVRMGRDIDLQEWPFLQCRPKERTALITAGQIITQHPQSGARHVGCALFSVRGSDSLGVHWTPQDAAYSHFRGYRDEHRQMPLAIVLGGDPVLRFLASLPLPREADAYLLAGYLRERNVDVVKARTVELHVPACADVVIEGFIDTEAELEPSRPIALPTGFYSLTENVPVMQVSSVTHRSNPVIPAMIPGRPPTEQTWLDRAADRLLLPIVALFLPEIVNLHRPSAGAGQNFVFVSIRKEFPQQARKVMNALWGLNGFATAKWIVVVDSDVDVHDEGDVWFHLGANVHPGRDVAFCDGPTHGGDHAAPIAGVGQKIGIDATRKSADEGQPREWPDALDMTRQMQELVQHRWAEYGIDIPWKGSHV